MKKRKTYEVSVINKTYSKTYSDETKFYTSDTALELNFQLKEVEYDFDSAEIILLNVDDRSLATRPISKSAEGFTYELEDDIVAHYGEWKCQLKFNEGGEIYVSSPVVFRIENDLSNDRPPTLTDVNNWETLRNNASKLIAEMSDVVANEAARIEAENQRAEGYQEMINFIDNFEIGVNAVGTENIKDSAVIPGKTTFLNRKSPNLLDKSLATIGVAVSAGNGSLAPYAGYYTSDFIEVEGGKTYSSRYNGNKAIYDENKEFILGSTSTDITTPSNGFWLRMSYASSRLDEMLVEGLILPDNYIEFDDRYTLNDQVHIDKTIEQDDLKSRIVSPDKTTFLAKDTSKINLLNPDTLTFDRAVSKDNGNLTSYVGYVTSDFIPVSPNSVIITSDARNKAVYDENKTFISGDNSQTITIPNNGAFVRVSFPSSRLNLEMVIESDVFPTEKYEYGAPIKYKFSDDIKVEVESSDSLSYFEKSWEGKKTVHLGDSITQLAANGTKKYYQYLREWLPLGSVKQYGISTSTISSGSGAYEPFVNRYHLMDDDADLVTVFGGTNDWGRTETTKGEFYSTDGTVNKDATTMYGACHILFEGLVKKYANRGAEIVILLPIQRVGQDVPNATTGMTLKEYTEVIKEVAHFYSLPVLDLYNEGGMNPNLSEVKTKYFADNTHPNNAGQERIAHRLLGYLRSVY